MVSLIACVWIVFLLLSKGYRAEGTEDVNFEDLIYTSMKSIVSLDELVTELSIQVAKLTTSLSQIKVDGERTQKDLEHLRTKIEDVEDYGMIGLEKKIEHMRAKLSTTDEKVVKNQQDMQHANNTLQNQIDKLATSMVKFVEDANDTKIAVESQFNKLTVSVADVAAVVEEMDDEVLIVGSEEVAGASKCVKVCAGTTGRGSTNWITYGSGDLYVDVDIGGCGFVKVPTVTTSVEGSSNHWTARGTSSIYSVKSNSFRLYIDHSISPSSANSLSWNVEWIAVGYTC